MRILLLLSALNMLWNGGTAFSFQKNGLPDPASLSQKAVFRSEMSVPTRRDTIKMPSQTPMVPWKVSEPSNPPKKGDLSGLDVTE